MQAQSHNLPPRFEHIGRGVYYINFNITQDTLDVDGTTRIIYMYECVKVDRLTRDNIISSIIRDRYNTDQMEAILQNYLNGVNAVDYVKLQHYREYAKAIADDKSAEVIDALKIAHAFEVTLPLDLTMPGGAYSTLADKMLRLKVPYIVDQQVNTAKAYPGWIKAEDLAILNADNRVTITQFQLLT